MTTLVCLRARQAWLNGPGMDPLGFPPAVLRHLASCRECQAHYAMVKGIDSGLRRLPPRMPSDSFVPRVMRAISKPAIRPVGAWDSKWNLTAAVAASILLLTTANYFTQGPGNPVVADAASHGVSGAGHLYEGIRSVLKGLMQP